MPIATGSGPEAAASHNPFSRALAAVASVTGPHARMERFILEAAVLSFAMVAVLVAAVYFYIEAGRIDLAERAVYTPEFTTTVSHVSGDVVSCGSDPSGRHAFVLFKFDSPSQVSLDPTQWRVVLSRSRIAGNSEDPLCVPEGRLTFFSDTGYCLLLMESIDENPFPDEVLDVRLETKAGLSTSNVGDEPHEAVGAESAQGFDGSDYLKVDVNPMAADAVDLGRYMDGETVDTRALYLGEVTSETDEQERTSTEAAFTSLEQAAARVREYDTRATQVGLAHTGGATVALMDSDLIDADAKRLRRTDDKAGTDIEWGSSDLVSGGSYARTASGSFADAEELVRAFEKAKATQEREDFSDVEWTLNGEPYDTSGLSRSAAQKVEQAKAELEQAWASYMAARKTYIDAMADLVAVEADVDAAMAFSVESKEDQLWIG